MGDTLSYALAGLSGAAIIVQGLIIHIQVRTERSIDQLADRVDAIEQHCMALRCGNCGAPWNGTERRKR